MTFDPIHDLHQLIDRRIMLMGEGRSFELIRGRVVSVAPEHLRLAATLDGGGVSVPEIVYPPAMSPRVGDDIIVIRRRDGFLLALQVIERSWDTSQTSPTILPHYPYGTDLGSPELPFGTGYLGWLDLTTRSEQRVASLAVTHFGADGAAVIELRRARDKRLDDFSVQGLDPLAPDDVLGSILASGLSSNGTWEPGAAILFEAVAEAVEGTPSRISFQTTGVEDTQPTTRLIVGDDGTIDLSGGALVNLADPVDGSGVGDRDYNDDRYSGGSPGTGYTDAEAIAAVEGEPTLALSGDLAVSGSLAVAGSRAINLANGTDDISCPAETFFLLLYMSGSDRALTGIDSSASAEGQIITLGHNDPYTLTLVDYSWDSADGNRFLLPDRSSLYLRQNDELLLRWDGDFWKPISQSRVHDHSLASDGKALAPDSILLSGSLSGPSDPTTGAGVGDRDYNDGRYMSEQPTGDVEFDGDVSLSGRLTGPEDPQDSSGVGDRGYNDARYEAIGAQPFVLGATGITIVRTFSWIESPWWEEDDDRPIRWEQYWTKPDGLTRVMIELVGGGGGGGGAANTLQFQGANGAGGGGGGYQRVVYSAVELATAACSQLTIRVGEGGLGGYGYENDVGGVPAKAGGPTDLVDPPILGTGTHGTGTFPDILVASGGQGGQGGQGTSGNAARSGGTSGEGSYTAANSDEWVGGRLSLSGSQGLHATVVGNGTRGMFGFGGASGGPFGSSQGTPVDSGDGNNAELWGNGGSGANTMSNEPDTHTGGNGSPGVCIVTEYY